MSWSIQRTGLPAEVLAAVKADPQAAHMPDGLQLLIEELLGKQSGPVVLSTYGHIHEGAFLPGSTIGEAHLTIFASEALKEEAPASEKVEAGKEEAPA